MDVRGCACQSSDGSSGDEDPGGSTLVSHCMSRSSEHTAQTQEQDLLEGFNNDFVQPLDPKHECKVCMLVLREPYQTQCGHRFCYGCIKKWISHRPTCPLDNEILTDDTIYPDNFAKREILCLIVRCVNAGKGCSAVMQLKHIEEHLQKCPHRAVPCPLGCGEDVEVKDLETHEQYSCNLRRYSCNKCGGQITYMNIKEHESTCPKSQISCKFCEGKFLRDKLDHHQRKECPEVLAKCSYSMFGCDFEKKRKQLERHLAESTNEHLECMRQYILNHGLYGETISTDSIHRSTRPKSMDLRQTGEQERLKQKLEYTGSDPGPIPNTFSDYGSLHKDLFQSHGAILEKTFSSPFQQGTNSAESNVRSLQQTVAQQGQMIAELQGKALRNENLRTELNTVKSKLEHIEERTCNGRYLWRIDQYSKLIEDATKGKMTVIHSKGFYTSVFGYKVCLRINLNTKGTYLSIFVHLMQGEYDDYLEWPFSGKISLTVLDQNPGCSERKHVTEMFVASPSLAAFQRPTSARNHKGFGYMDFIPLEVIRDGFYLRNDTLVIKAVISELGE